jgi:hypothetical protein
MSINSAKYTGKSTLLKLKRLMSIHKTTKKNSDRLGFLHMVRQDIRDPSGNIVMTNTFSNVIMANCHKTYEKLLINSYRISDIFDVEQSEKVVTINSKNKECSMRSTVTLLEIK